MRIGDNCLVVVEEICCRHSEIISLRFLEYFYVPREIGECERARPFFLTREEFLAGEKLSLRVALLSAGWDIGLHSEVMLNRGARHIPTMDFEVPISFETERKLQERLEEIVVPVSGPGVLLNSGNSYQFVGTVKLLDRSEWLDFLALALLTSIVHAKFDEEHFAHVRWIGHSLLRRAGVLRVSARTKPMLPQVIAFVGGEKGGG